MPALEEGSRSRVRVAGSAPLELMWIIHALASDFGHEGMHPALEDLRAEYRPHIGSMFGDAMPNYSTEMLVLAHRSGTMLDLDLERFFGLLEDSIANGALPSLRSESEAEIDIARARLERLRVDPGLRKRYRGLLGEIWSEFADSWEREGRAAVIAESERWANALDAGLTYTQIVDLACLWPGRSQFKALADAAAADGKLVLNPCWFGGKVHMIELDGEVHAGRGIQERELSYRKVAAHISSNLKALADPTRLAILLRLARGPASVTEVARQFDLSQPTVSAHVQILREAGLLEEKTVGRSAQLSASEDGLRRLFSNAQDSLLNLFRS